MFRYCLSCFLWKASSLIFVDLFATLMEQWYNKVFSLHRNDIFFEIFILDIHHMNMSNLNLNEIFVQRFHPSVGPSFNHRWPGLFHSHNTGVETSFLNFLHVRSEKLLSPGIKL